MEPLVSSTVVLTLQIAWSIRQTNSKWNYYVLCIICLPFENALPFAYGCWRDTCTTNSSCNNQPPSLHPLSTLINLKLLKRNLAMCSRLPIIPSVPAQTYCFMFPDESGSVSPWIWASIVAFFDQQDAEVKPYQFWAWPPGAWQLLLEPWATTG